MGFAPPSLRPVIGAGQRRRGCPVARLDLVSVHDRSATLAVPKGMSGLASKSRHCVLNRSVRAALTLSWRSEGLLAGAAFTSTPRSLRR